MNTDVSAVLDPVSAKSTVSTVLLATDLQPCSHLALEYAAAIAHSFDACLFIVHAFELTAIAETVEEVDHIQSRTRLKAEENLKSFIAKADISSKITTKWCMMQGTVRKAILEAVKKHSADILVLGTKGVKRGINHLLLGSNTEALMLHSPCPTVTVGPQVRRGISIDTHLRKAVYVSDHTTPSIPAIKHALQLCNTIAHETEVMQLVADETLADSVRSQQVAQEFAKAMLPHQPQHNWADPSYQLSRLITPQQLLSLSSDQSILLALGVQPQTYLGRHIHTCTAYKLLADAACPILTLRDE